MARHSHVCYRHARILTIEHFVTYVDIQADVSLGKGNSVLPPSFISYVICVGDIKYIVFIRIHLQIFAYAFIFSVFNLLHKTTRNKPALQQTEKKQQTTRYILRHIKKKGGDRIMRIMSKV